MRFYLKLRKTKPGNVMLLALLLLAGGLVGGIAVSVLVISEIKQAASLDSSLIAYYDAESGLEQGLYDIRRTNECDTGCVDTVYVECKAEAKCDLKINPAQQINVPSIEQDQLFQVDMSTADGIESLTVDWERRSVDVDPLLSITFINNSGTFGLETVRPNNGNPIPCVSAPDELVCDPLQYNDPLSSPPDVVFITDETEQVRFKAIDSDIIELKVKPTCVPGLDCVFSYYLDVASKAQSGRVQYEVKTIIPKQLPTYGYPDYVIFSQQEIKK